MEKERLRSYFNESMIYEGIMNPTGSNIAPKFLNASRIKGVTVSGYFETDINYEDAAETLSEDAISVRGNFNYGQVKEYLEPARTCYEMYDEGAFTSLVRKEDDTCVSIKTDIGISRKAVGSNFDGTLSRDGMFPNINHTSSKGCVTYHEYYRILENGMQMLHYSDANYPNGDIFFEMYSIPDDYKVSDGLDDLAKPMVFNFKTFNKQHPSYHEIEELIKPKEKAKVLVREQYQAQQEARKGYYFK